MVDKIFYIKGDRIFDVGLRFSLVGLGGEYNIKVQAVNERSDDRVRVVTSGDVQSISKYSILDGRVRAKLQGVSV